jgi:predicted Mrr-cat superfamily restriction endonuclease
MSPSPASLDLVADKMRAFRSRLLTAGFGDSYEAAHAQLILDAVAAAREHRALVETSKLSRLPEASQAAADQSYIDTVTRLSDGLAALMQSYEKSSDERARKICGLYAAEK